MLSAYTLLSFDPINTVDPPADNAGEPRTSSPVAYFHFTDPFSTPARIYWDDMHAQLIFDLNGEG